MRARAGSLLLSLALVSLPLPLSAGSLDPAATLLEQGRADQALALVSQALATDASDAAALNLECRVFLSEQRFDEAEPPCEQAVERDGRSSAYHLWLGRVLGRQAERASPLKAYGIAKHVRVDFETAYRLDPRSTEAAADLATFYVRAPRLLGGGQAKAETLAAEVEPWSSALAHSIRAQVAESNKDAETAERELLAASSSPNVAADSYVSLAGFYRRQERIPEMLASIDKAVALDTAHDDGLVSLSEELTRSGQRPDQAIALLRTYLASRHQSEEAPAFQVHARLARLLAARGDSGGAEVELAAAHSLASGWQLRERKNHDV